MLLLNKSVLFGPKKGVASVYYSLRNGSALNILKTLKPSSTYFKDKNVINHLHQYSLFSSRFTSLVLVFFWLIFMFSGESLLLILMNFSTPIDSIYSSTFLEFSAFTCFSTINTSFYTLDAVFNYILLSTLIAVKFLYMYKFKNTRNSLSIFFLVDLIIFSFVFTKL